MDVLQSKVTGLVPQFVSPKTGDLKPGILTLGARADSYYEYLLKQWLQSGRTEEKLVDVVTSLGGGGGGVKALVDQVQGIVGRA